MAIAIEWEAIGDMHDDITYFRPRLLMVSVHHSYHRKCIDFDDHQCYFLKMLASYSSHSYLIIGMDSSQNFPRAGSKFGIFWIGGCGEMEREPTASSSQNSLTGGCGSCGSDPTTTGGETEGILGSDLTCGALLRTLKQVKFHCLFEGRGYSWKDFLCSFSATKTFRKT